MLVKRRSSKRQSAIEKRRASRGFKKKQFQLHQSRLKIWRQGLKARREARAAQLKLREERENTSLPIFVVTRRKRRYMTALDCPLDTCPKKIRMLKQLKRLEMSSSEDESDDSYSLPTQISKSSGRRRSPLRVVRRN